jgi:hypothetical protein
VSTRFSIEIVEQGWIAPDAGDEDLCSHGRIRLVIEDETILDGGPDVGVGVSETALALLRTLDSDHTRDAPVAERLVFHGCGMILMLGCYMGVDWEVHHDGDQVHLSKVCVDDGPAQNIATTLTRNEYEGALLAFADEATQPFRGVTKRVTGEFERDQYQAFWGSTTKSWATTARRPSRQGRSSRAGRRSGAGSAARWTRWKRSGCGKNRAATPNGRLTLCCSRSIADA